MKTRLLARGAAVLGLAVLLGSCAGGPPDRAGGTAPPAPQVAAAPPPQQAKTIERIIVDYKGAAIGAEIPAWVQAAVDNDYERIAKLPQFKGKVPIIDYGYGQNLDLLRSWVNNFNVQAGVARRISSSIQAEFGGEQLGTKDSPENRNFVKEVVATFSQTEISGLAQELDYWTRLRTIDREKGTETEQYTYFVVYSISEEDLNFQIARALGKAAAQTAEQEELKTDVENALKSLKAFKGIQAAE